MVPRYRRTGAGRPARIFKTVHSTGLGPLEMTYALAGGQRARAKTDGWGRLAALLEKGAPALAHGMSAEE